MRLPVFLLSWLKRTFSLSLVAGKRAIGQETSERRRYPFQFARAAAMTHTPKAGEVRKRPGWSHPRAFRATGTDSEPVLLMRPGHAPFGEAFNGSGRRRKRSSPPSPGGCSGHDLD